MLIHVQEGFIQKKQNEKIKLIEPDEPDFLKELHVQEDRSIMQDASIIAMTTSGAARYQRRLREERVK